MAPRRALANVSFTVDSASEDEMAPRDGLPTPDSNTENKAPTRKPRGRPAKTEKPAPATKATARGQTAAQKKSAAAPKKAGLKGGRKALAERENANLSDTEEVDEFDGEVEPAPEEATKPAKRGRSAKAKKDQEDELVAEVVAPKRTRRTADAAPAVKTAPKSKAAPKAKAAPKPRATKRVPKVEPEPEPDMTIPETQPEPEPEDVDTDMDDVEESIEMEELPETMPPPPRPSARRTPQQPRVPSRQTSAGPRRAGSASDTERDPALRRKLGEITRRLEAMTAKYDNIKDVATAQRESHFEQLKQHTEQITKNQDAVITSLKQQVSEMQSRAGEITSMKKDLAKLTKENTRLEAENTTLKISLDSTQKENKGLLTKLTAARSSAPADNKTMPGSAMKARQTGVVLPGAAEAAKEAQLRQHKIELYSDLTDLVIVSIKKGEEGEDVFNCLQTGRNGTLHFQLSIDTEEEDPHFIYTPQLDEKRDSELLDLLPDYLTDDIEFPRNQVANFYKKILDSMAKKIELEEDD